MSDININLVGPDQRLALAAAERAQQVADDIAADGAAAVALATSEADRAESFATALEIGNPNDWYASLSAGAAAVSEGDGFVVVDADGEVSLGKKESGVGVEKARFTTRSSLRNHGINLWEEATGDGVTSDTDAINDVIDTAAAWGIGRINCGGSNKVYLCGGDYTSYGTFPLREKGEAEVSIPFRRGRIPLKSGIAFVGAHKGSRAKFLAASGDKDPGGLFYVPFWETLPDDEVRGVTFRHVEIDGNMANQTFSAYSRNTPDGNMWIQGHAIAGGALHELVVYESKIHGWWGHGVFGFNADDFGMTSDEFVLIGNDIFDNMQGGAQAGINRFYSERNRYHGDGGWTALGPNIEVGDNATSMLDIWSVNDTFDGRDGWSTVLATVKDWGGNTGLDTDDSAALAARVHHRRGMWLSGDYYEGAPGPGNVFNRLKGRVHIVNPKCWQATIGGGGADRIHVVSPQMETTYEDYSGQWPPHGGPIEFGASFNASETRDQITIRDAQMTCDVDAPQIKLNRFKKVDVSAQITGGRDAGVRLESCGGRVVVDVEDVGKIMDRDDWLAFLGLSSSTENDVIADALIGSTSSAVVAFGSLGPLHIDAQAVDTRAGGARRMEYAVYANVDTTFPTRVSGAASGMISAALKDVNGTTFDMGLIDATDRTVNFNAPVVFSGSSFTVNGPLVTLESPSGDMDLQLRSADGSNRKISMFEDGGLEAQIVHLTGGDMQFQLFDNGSSVGVPLVMADDGHVRANFDWRYPLHIVAPGGAFGGWVWLASSGKLYINGTRPAGDTDGTVVGTQT